ncbi:MULTISPECIES: hypothetical protein [unclassified Bradyrhizobium]|nr:hypothetical protein [Bradyrhizobium sp. USDA 4541]MCP1852877.1 hypothetical protein [Bradyrhizobium sp. USDA 4541]
MDLLNWVSDHPVLTITLSLIASATYAVPRIVTAVTARNINISSRL